MSFFEDASLVLIPSGYKASKVYSVKPTDGTGDLTFTRSLDTATRVGPDGLIEKVRTNLLPSSNNISIASTYWAANQSGTTTQNAAVAPDGTTTAALITPNGVGVYSGVTSTTNPTLAAVPNTYSVYLKTNSGTANVNILAIDSGSTFYGLTPIVVNTTWTRYTLTFTPASGASQIYITSAGSTAWLAWGAQLESSDIATDLIPTTTAAVSVGMLANVPRLDYLGGGCPKLLLEPQRTNLALFSEQYNNAAWTKNGATATANTSVSPAGFTDADTIEKVGGSGGVSFYYIVASVTSNTTNTFSIFAKYKEGSGIIWLLGKNSGTFAFFNLQTGTALSATAGMTTKIENYGNGWYRCSFTQDYTGASDYTFGIGLCLVAGTPNYDATSAATQGAFIYGGQFEVGSYPTSYIPTLGAAVTRSADAASKTGISALIGQTEGVIFVDIVYNAVTAGTSASNIINSENNTNASFFINRIPSTGLCNSGLFVSGSATATINGGLITLGQRTKIAYAYKSGSSTLYINGVQIGTNAATYTLPSTLDDILINDVVTYFSFQENVSFNQVLLFKTRLTNAQLAELTTI